MADPSPDYFRFPHAGWIATLSTGLYCLTMATFNPEGIPWFFGPLGQLGTYLGTTYPIFTRNLFYLTFVVHIGEAIYSIKLCRDKNLSSTATVKWCLQTFLWGFASLMRLKIAPKVKSR